MKSPGQSSWGTGTGSEDTGKQIAHCPRVNALTRIQQEWKHTAPFRKAPQLNLPGKAQLGAGRWNSKVKQGHSGDKGTIQAGPRARTLPSKDSDLKVVSEGTKEDTGPDRVGGPGS